MTHRCVWDAVMNRYPTAPIEPMWSKPTESPFRDGNVNVPQVMESRDHSIQRHVLMSAKSSSVAWDLRSEIREKMITWLQSERPQALLRIRTQVVNTRPAKGDHPWALGSGDTVSARETGLRQSFKTEQVGKDSPRGIG